MKIEEGGWKFLVNYDRLSMHEAGTWEQVRVWGWRRGKVKVMGCRMRTTREEAGGDGGWRGQGQRVESGGELRMVMRETWALP